MKPNGVSDGRVPEEIARRVNLLLDLGIGGSLVAIPGIALLGSSGRVLTGFLMVLAALVALRQPAVQYVLAVMWVWVRGATHLRTAGMRLVRAAWLPLLAAVLTVVLPTGPRWLGLSAIAMLLPALVALNHFLHGRSWRVAAACAVLAPLLALLWLLHFDAQVAPIGVDSLEAVLQTDLAEAWQFIVANSSPTFPRLVGILFALAFLAVVPTPSATVADSADRDFIGQQVWLLSAAALLMIAATDLGARVSGVMHGINESVANYRVQKARFELDAEPFADPGRVGVAGRSPDIVVYIGESTTRHHMGVYGYPRPTTPFLSSLGQGIVRFDDVVSPHTHTAQSLREMLTDLNFDGSKLARTARNPYGVPLAPYSLPDVLNAAGIRTWWLSNHNEFGIWDNPVTTIARRAQNVRYFRKSVGKSFDASYFDDFMVRQAAGLIGAEDSAAPRAIFIHSYAGHADYCRNIPETWRDRFTASWPAAAYFGDMGGDRRRVDCYDSAMAYIDDNLRQVIEAARGQRRPTIVIYVADHGEDVDDGSGHNSELHTYQHIDVPLLVYFNDAARAASPDSFARLRANRGLPYESADLYHLVSDLARIETPLIDRSRSPAAEAFRIRPRQALPRGNAWLALDDEPPGDVADIRDTVETARSRLRALPPRDRDKLCIHHANTLAKLRQAAQLAACAEFDAAFDPETMRFKVHHPPDPDLGLDLATYLEWAGPLRLWMDWKNLTPENAAQAFAELERLDARFGLRQRMVVEIGADFLEAKHDPTQFGALSAGWRLSLYLPTDKGVHCRDPSVMSSRECRELEARIADTVKRYGFADISFDSEVYPWVRDSAALGRMSFMVWKFSEILGRSDMLFTGQEMFRKSRVFLLPMASKHASGQFDCCEHLAYR
jgi:glucan phosphoethanolaminetransferase (alkaline phosphatase superfamily)